MSSIKISQLPAASPITGNEDLIVNQDGDTRLTNVNEVVGIVTFVQSSGISSTLTLDASVNTSGIITASNFYGNFNGNATSANYADVAGISTLSEGLTGTPSIVVASVNTSGIITADGGFNIGISSAGVAVTTGPVKTINFVGDNNTVSVDGTTVDVNIEASPSGSDGEIQFHNGQTPAGLGATTGFKWDVSEDRLDVPGDINLDDGGTFTTTLQMVTATQDNTISFPNSTGTVALVAGSSGQLIYNSAGALAGGAAFDSTTGTLGYSSGGTITQTTSKSTDVTLNGPSGVITLNSEALAANTVVSFNLLNNSITNNDLLLMNHISGGTAGAYTLNAQAGISSAIINVRNVTAGSLSEAIVIRFAIIKA